MNLTSDNALVVVPAALADDVLAREDCGVRPAPGVRDSVLVEASAIVISTMAVSADSLSLILARDQVAPFARGLLSSMRKRQVAEVTVSAGFDGYRFKASVRSETGDLDAAEVLRQAANFVDATRPPR